MSRGHRRTSTSAYADARHNILGELDRLSSPSRERSSRSRGSDIGRALYPPITSVSSSDWDSERAQEWAERNPVAATITREHLGLRAGPRDRTYESMMAGWERSLIQDMETSRLEGSTSSEDHQLETTMVPLGPPRPWDPLNTLGPPQMHSTAFSTPRGESPRRGILQTTRDARNESPRTAQAALSGPVRRSTRGKVVQFTNLCDLMLPEGEYLNQMNAVLANLRTPMGQPLVKLKLPDNLKLRYGTPYLYVNNVTGVILGGELTTIKFFDLKPTGKWCSFERIPGLTTGSPEDYPTVRTFGPNDQEYPRWSYHGKNAELDPIEQVEVTGLPQVDCRFANQGYLVSYKPKELWGTPVYLDPWTGDVYETYERAGSLLDSYLVYEGGCLPLVPPKRHRHGIHLGIGRRTAPSIDNWRLPGNLRVGDLANYVSDIPSPRGHNTRVFNTGRYLTEYFKQPNVNLHMDLVTGEVLVPNNKNELVFTSLTALTPGQYEKQEQRAYREEERQDLTTSQAPTRPQVPYRLPDSGIEPEAARRAAIVASQQAMKDSMRATPNLLPITPGTPYRSKVSKDSPLKDYQDWKTLLAKLEIHGQWLVRRNPNVSTRGTLLQMLASIGEEAYDRVGCYEELYPDMREMVSEDTIRQSVIPPGLPEHLLKFQEDLTDRDVVFLEEIPEEEMKATTDPLALMEAVTSLDGTEPPHITTLAQKREDVFVAACQAALTEAQQTYLKEFSVPPNWTDPPHQPLRPIRRVGYKDQEIIQGLKDSTLGDSKKYRLDNVENITDPGLLEPFRLEFDSVGKIVRDYRTKEPTWAYCKLCYSTQHVHQDCWVTPEVQRRKLERGPENQPYGCKICKTFQHSTANCRIWDFYKECLLCGSTHHQPPFCPLRLPQAKQKEMVRQGLQSKACESCACSKEGVLVACYHAPDESSLTPGYSFWGKPCEGCSERCVCQFELKAHRFCPTCGDPLEGDPVHAGACPKATSKKEKICSHCGLSGHRDTFCRSQMLERFGHGHPPCRICNDDGHLPKDCPEYNTEKGRRVVKAYRQCDICLERDHSIDECPSALSPPLEESRDRYCCFCGKGDHHHFLCPKPTPSGATVAVPQLNVTPKMRPPGTPELGAIRIGDSPQDYFWDNQGIKPVPTPRPRPSVMPAGPTEDPSDNSSTETHATITQSRVLLQKLEEERAILQQEKEAAKQGLLELLKRPVEDYRVAVLRNALYNPQVPCDPDPTDNPLLLQRIQEKYGKLLPPGVKMSLPLAVQIAGEEDRYKTLYPSAPIGTASPIPGEAVVQWEKDPRQAIVAMALGKFQPSRNNLQVSESPGRLQRIRNTYHDVVPPEREINMALANQIAEEEILYHSQKPVPPGTNPGNDAEVLAQIEQANLEWAKRRRLQEEAEALRRNRQEELELLEERNQEAMRAARDELYRKIAREQQEERDQRLQRYLQEQENILASVTPPQPQEHTNREEHSSRERNPPNHTQQNTEIPPSTNRPRSLPSTRPPRRRALGAGGNGGDGDDSDNGDDERGPADYMGRRISPVRRPRRRMENPPGPVESTDSEMKAAVQALIQGQQALLNQTQLLTNQSMGVANQSLLTDEQFSEMNNQLKTIADASSVHTIESIPIYDGKDPQAFMDWLDDLEDTCAQFRLDPLQTALLRSTGAVRQILGKYRVGQRWLDIRARLIQQFSPYPTDHHASHALNQMAQGSEGLETYIHKYTRLFQMINYVDLHDVTQKSDISNFLVSLRNAKLASMVQKANPKSLKEAMQLALAKQTPMLNEEGVRQFQRTGTTSVQPRVKKVLAVERTQLEKSPDPKQSSRDLVEMVLGDDGIARPKYEILAINQGKSPKDSTCFECGQVGHWSWDCNKPKSNRPPGPPAQGRLNTTLTASTPVTEGLYDFLRDVLANQTRTAQRAQQRKDHYKQALHQQHMETKQSSPGDQGATAQGYRRPPNARKPQDGRNDAQKNPRPPRGGAKKFDLVPPKAAVKKDPQVPTPSSPTVNSIDIIDEYPEGEFLDEMPKVSTSFHINSIESAVPTDSEDEDVQDE